MVLKRALPMVRTTMEPSHSPDSWTHRMSRCTNLGNRELQKTQKKKHRRTSQPTESQES
nr:MAG: hypothetical protein AmFV_00166 [Apis mellifera filamentous virus]WOK43281.1 MAG: hypothetical protein [Apis mellifera filamentous virus]